MSPMVFPDNTVLCSFAAVSRLDLLEGWLRGRGRWTAAVAYEAAQSARWLRALSELPTQGWMGEPIDLDEEHAPRIERIRRVVFSGAIRKPLRTIDIVRRIVADGDLDVDVAFALMRAMADAGRGLRLPSSPRDLA